MTQSSTYCDPREAMTMSRSELDRLCPPWHPEHESFEQWTARIHYLAHPSDATEPAELAEPIGPDDDDSQWWAENAPDETDFTFDGDPDDEPADPAAWPDWTDQRWTVGVEPAEWEPSWPSQADGGPELADDMEDQAGADAWHRALEAYQARDGRLTAEDVQTATGCF